MYIVPDQTNLMEHESGGFKLSLASFHSNAPTFSCLVRLENDHDEVADESTT